MLSFETTSVVRFSRKPFFYGAYAFGLQHETQSFFNAFPTRLTVLEAPKTSDRARRTIVAFVWLLSAYGYEKPQVLKMIEAYRKHRISDLYYAQPSEY